MIVGVAIVALAYGAVRYRLRAREFPRRAAHHAALERAANFQMEVARMGAENFADLQSISEEEKRGLRAIVEGSCRRARDASEAQTVDPGRSASDDDDACERKVAEYRGRFRPDFARVDRQIAGYKAKVEAAIKLGESLEKLAIYHARMRAKYEKAAMHPWHPDPPEPD